MPTPSPVAVVSSSTSPSASFDSKKNRRGKTTKTIHVGRDDESESKGRNLNDQREEGSKQKLAVSTAKVTLVSPTSRKITTQSDVGSNTNVEKKLLSNGSCLKDKEAASVVVASTAESSLRRAISPRGSPNLSSTRQSSNNSHPLSEKSKDSESKEVNPSPRRQPSSQQLPQSQQQEQQQQRLSQQPQEQQKLPQPQQQRRCKPPVVSLSSDESEINNAGKRKPVVNFCPIQLSSPDSSVISVAETGVVKAADAASPIDGPTTPPYPPPEDADSIVNAEIVTAETATAVISPSDCPTTPPYPPPKDAEFPPNSVCPSSSVVQVQADVHAEPEPRPIIEEGQFPRFTCLRLTVCQSGGLGKFS